MPKIISSTALRNGYSEVSEWCHASQEPAFVTRNGAGDLAVMSIDAYEQMSSRLDLYDALSAGRRDIACGNSHPAREGIARLRAKHGLTESDA